MTTVTRKVWVPNVVTETVPVTTSNQEQRVVNYTVYEQQTEEIPYQCTTIGYRSETRTGTKQVVRYVDEERTRMRKVVQYNDETRTRMRREMTYENVTKTETVPYVTYVSETRTKEVPYSYTVPTYTLEPYETTRYDRVASEEVEEYSVEVPHTVMTEEQVQVMKMVPRLVEETIQPCCDSATAASGTTIGSGATTGSGAATGGMILQGSSPSMATPTLSLPAVGGCGCGSAAAPAPVVTTGGCGC